MDGEKIIIFQRMSDKSELLVFKTSAKRRAALTFANALVEHQNFASVKDALAFIYDNYTVREDLLIPVD